MRPPVPAGPIGAAAILGAQALPAGLPLGSARLFRELVAHGLIADRAAAAEEGDEPKGRDVREAPHPRYRSAVSRRATPGSSTWRGPSRRAAASRRADGAGRNLPNGETSGRSKTGRPFFLGGQQNARPGDPHRAQVGSVRTLTPQQCRTLRQQGRFGPARQAGQKTPPSAARRCEELATGTQATDGRTAAPGGRPLLMRGARRKPPGRPRRHEVLVERNTATGERRARRSVPRP
jgi:hypothetical protein